MKRLFQRLIGGFRPPSAPSTTPHLKYIHVEKLLYFKRIFDQVKHLGGDIVECGVGRGRSLAMLAFLAIDEGKGRNIWGFDSFEGLPESSAEDNSIRRLKAGQIKYGTYEVKEYLDRSGVDPFYFRSHISLVKGFFQESLSKYRGSGIVLLHLDVDLYESYRTTLQELYPKVVPGGAVLFDEYMGTWEHLHFPGAQKAIDEYLQDKQVPILRDKMSGKYYLIKPAEDHQEARHLLSETAS